MKKVHEGYTQKVVLEMTRAEIKSKNSKNVYTPMGAFDCELNDGTMAEGSWRKDNINQNQTSMFNLKKIPRKSPSNAQAIREEFSEYFMTSGRIPWQNNRA
ncbi:hypothetical protein NQ318_023522 [Aromia moschata]|uniref:Uncharacterized protein n=1 Tax=Aromia moschata TaxID=1265417 RepID=A0AAV8YQ31_9CUCU|nr:hypothetical protein NQ318_023522 [Aromia moschata]